jgi:hypothetical protein
MTETGSSAPGVGGEDARGDDIVLRIRADELAWRELDGSAVLLDLRSSTYLEANPTATVLWRRLEQGATRAGLIDALVEEYGITVDAATADVGAFLERCRSRDLLETDPIKD